MPKIPALPRKAAAALRSILPAILLGFMTSPASPQAIVTQIAPLPLTAGPNRVERITPDGRGGIIMLAWWSMGTASSSYTQFTVTLQDKTDGGWSAVAFENKDAPDQDQIALSIRDWPHVGEDSIRAVRFARAVVNGQPQIVLFIARRNTVESYFDPAETTVELLLLQEEDGIAPTYRRAQEVRLPAKYCNAEVALSQTMGLPRRPRSGSKQTPDGC